LHYGRYLHERIQGKPTQYITKKQEFYGRDFRVTPDVLIPRPETELLVEAVLKSLKSITQSCWTRDFSRVGYFKEHTSGVAIDVGTGSGAIAVTLALETRTNVIATDLSAKALEIARHNAATLSARLQFVECDLLEAFADVAADLIVSNPPYVALDADLQREVRAHEPHLALFAGTSGLEIYRRLIPEAGRVLKPGGTLALELGFGQAAEVQTFASGFTNIRTLDDLAGIPRVLVCEKP
jgi:release factor glutamine methyltransferase